MKTNNKHRKNISFDVEIGLAGSKDWTDEQLAKVQSLVKENAAKHTPERRLKNEILSIRYQMELYIDNKDISLKNISTIEDFLGNYLKTLSLTFKKFATAIDTTDGNLKKYLSGDRKFNIDLAMKFSCFFHTPPELWLKIQIKNELLELQQNKTEVKKYARYNYEKLLEFA